MRILVCGGRDYGLELSQRGIIWQALYKLIKEFDNHELIFIFGGAPGTDTVAQEWAKTNEYDHMVFPAKWKRYQRAAGSIRNRKMLSALPELVIAFPGGVGTADMVAIAKENGIEVREIR